MNTSHSSARPDPWQPPTPEELSGLLPGYEITALLGRGGMGAVYKGIQLSLDREVAIKLLPPDLGADPDFQARFRREAKSMAKLNHPNIVQIFDYGQTASGQHYFIMEYVDGSDLLHLVRSGTLDAEGALNAVSQVCEALQYAHDLGFVHRDIKPANILINRKGVLKVGDFGLARLVEGHGDQASSVNEEMGLTMTGMTMGTPHYAAPEQLDGQGHIDHRADLYSLGIMFYEMLTRDVPRGTPKAPSRKIPNLDVRIDGVVFKAMEPDPEDRYQSATALRTDIDRIRSTPPAPTPAAEPPRPTPQAQRPQARPSPPRPPAAPGRPTKPPPRKSSFPLTAVIGTLVVLGGIFGYLQWQGSQNGPDKPDPAIAKTPPSEPESKSPASAPTTEALPKVPVIPPEAKDTPAGDLFSPLVAGLKEIGSPDQQGGILAYDPAWKGIVGGRDESQGPAGVVLARQFGSGRIVAISGNALWKIGTEEDNIRLLDNALPWLGNGPSRKVAVLSGVAELDHLWSRWKQSGFEFTRLSPGYGNDQLANFGMIISNHTWDDRTPSETQAVVDFVRGGGGLLITGLAWAYPKSPATYPQNILGAEFGVIWLGVGVRDETENFAGNILAPRFCRFYPDVHLFGIDEAFQIIRDAQKTSDASVEGTRQASLSLKARSLIDELVTAIPAPHSVIDRIDAFKASLPKIDPVKTSKAPTPPAPASAPAIAGPTPSEAGFTKIFNGRDLSGWAGDKRFWSVRDGIITAESPPNGSIPVNTCLIWQGGNVTDFELRLSYKITSGNSGVQYRSKVLDPAAWVVGGYQYEIATGKFEIKNGGLYEERGSRKALASPGGDYLANPGEKVEWTHEGARNVTGKLGDTAPNRTGDWNELTIICQGNRLMHRLNGTATIDMIDDDASAKAISGVLALQLHSGAPQKVQFKDIRIKQAKPASGRVSSLALKDASDKAQSLFDGSTLDGWLVGGDPASFKVEDGCIKASEAHGNLVFAGKGDAPAWKDLDLSMKVKTKATANSGVWIHCPATASAVNAFALEIQIANDAGAGQLTGSVFSIAPVNKQIVPNDQWFDLRVTVSGMTVTVFINGKKINEWTQPAGWTPPGSVPSARLGSGSIGFQSHSGETWFKDVRITLP